MRRTRIHDKRIYDTVGSDVNMIDLFLGIILPILIAALKFIAEPSRYHVAGVDGCTGHIVHAWPALPCYILWTPILCVIAGAYACTFMYLLLC